ncbi:uncharacterized protein LOC141674102 [Apium graveolens]|uniref:uncharacterized protein LOC141674102 n=1 Tax=Apium graveolens TaxID=4045 RepID=UPI003D7A465E
MTWVSLPKYSEAYSNGVTDFIQNAFDNFATGSELRCPCKDYSNRFWFSEEDVYDHLVSNGLCPSFVNWVYEMSILKFKKVDQEMDCDSGMGLGEDFDKMIRDESRVRNGMNNTAKRFYKLVEEGKQPLYPGCEQFTLLGFVVKLYLLKCTHGFTEGAFSGILKLIKEAFPDVNLPSSFKVAKNMIRKLGLDYQKIHACPNDCMMYWGENLNLTKYKISGVSSWKLPKNRTDAPVSPDLEEKKSKVPAKVLRYFPLKPRLQRLFMCKDYSKLMTWHALERTKDGKLRHPADAEGWKSMDANRPNFVADPRNIRLGLAANGINPYRSMNISHSTWPIILVNYNLPPWLIMKPENLILSTLVPRPVYPGNDIDVYMQPLIAELKELWEVGLQTYDAYADETFMLRSSLLWTISDFPGYAILSGWSTKGKLGCPNCHYCTSSLYLKHSRKVCYMNHKKFLPPDHKHRFDTRRFNGKVETDVCPPPLSGKDIEELLHGYENYFGKRDAKKRKRGADCPFKKKSIFFQLPYWRDNLIRHNLDVMHIEKNICDKIIGTLLNMGGKTKDHISARKDLQEMGIRKVLHPIKIGDSNRYEIRAATFDMTKKEKESFCTLFMDAKLPHRTVSNISRCVNVAERKIFGYKSHDAHFILQYLLQFAAVKNLKPEVAIPLVRLGAFFRGICGKVLELKEVHKLQEEVIEILCQLEINFPPAFFDIMVHLPVHLCKEVEFGGPVHLRWMFGIERYLGKLKSYVRNRSKPEGSIAEGYLAEECVTFCSRFLTNSRKIEIEKNINVGYPIGSRRNKDGKSVYLAEHVWINAHREHRILYDNEAKTKKYKKERTHTLEFHNWLKAKVEKRTENTLELSNLARGPQRAAKKFSGYVINGFRFHTRKRDTNCTTQNSGVILTTLTTSFASSKDQNPTVGDVIYYGAIEEIIEVDYWGAFTVVLFRCIWYQKDKDCFGLTRVNFSKLCQKDDPFVLATQVQQVFYIQDCTEKNLWFVVKKLPKEHNGIDEETDDMLEDLCGPTMHDTELEYPFQKQTDDVTWHRDDIPNENVSSGEEEEDHDDDHDE